MTSLEKLLRCNRWRVRSGQYASDETAGFNGHFLVPMSGELFNVRLSDGWGWRHLSVSNAQKRELPSWEVMRRLKECFFGDEDWCCQFFPAKQDYVNDCEWCLHIWQPLNETLPQPPIFMV